MRIYIDAFRTQKAGNTEAEYEDAFWSRDQSSVILPGQTVRIAVADGATDAVFSGLWARLLVKAYGRRHMTGETVADHLVRAARVWDRVVKRHSLPWYAEEKARNGTYAALLGLELTQTANGASGTWSALSCGDCCFFHLRSSELLRAFPVDRAACFSNSPVLCGSHPETRGLEGLVTAAGDWQEGDCFYLMSDALALWFITCCEQGLVPAQILRDVTLAKEPGFDEWIAGLRQQRAIKNDDCTLVALSFNYCREL